MLNEANDEVRQAHESAEGKKVKAEAGADLKDLGLEDLLEEAEIEGKETHARAQTAREIARESRVSRTYIPKGTLRVRDAPIQGQDQTHKSERSEIMTDSNFDESSQFDTTVDSEYSSDFDMTGRNDVSRSELQYDKNGEVYLYSKSQ